MEQKQKNFEEQLQYGREWEDRFAKCLIEKGWFVTPKYLFAKEGAPLLIGKNNKYAIPDIDAAKEGKRIWFECKRKKMFKNYYATGLHQSLFYCYKKVQEITGDKVFIIFEDDENRYDKEKYYGNFLDELEKNIYKKNGKDYWIIEGKPHTVFHYPEAFIKLTTKLFPTSTPSRP